VPGFSHMIKGTTRGGAQTPPLAKSAKKDKILSDFGLFCISMILSCVIYPIYSLKN